MAQVKVRKAKISELIQDDRNLNKGTARGKELIQKSIGQFGAVRGVAVDKDNRIIAGNKTVENAIEQGVEEIIIVETTGKELVVTKRVDTSLDTKEGREMALADNATVKADLQWDLDEMNAVADDFGIDFDDWKAELQMESKLKGYNDMSDKFNFEYKVEISVDSEAEQEHIYNELTERGFQCRILTL